MILAVSDQNQSRYA